MPTDEERQRRRNEEKAFVLAMGKWPLWPALPMKRSRTSGEQPSGTLPFEGVLVDRTPFTKPEVPKFDFYPGVNVFQPFEDWNTENARKNVNIDELLAEGWKVD